MHAVLSLNWQLDLVLQVTYIQNKTYLWICETHLHPEYGVRARTSSVYVALRKYMHETYLWINLLASLSRS